VELSDGIFATSLELLTLRGEPGSAIIWSTVV
jgi:hypothetical protein